MIFAKSDIAWGDVPTWIAGVVAGLTLAAAIVAAVMTARVYQLERNRDLYADADRAEAAERDLRSQAALVSAWLDTSAPRRVPAVLIRNASDLPVYSCSLLLQGSDGLKLIAELQVVPPTSQPVELPAVNLPTDEHASTSPVTLRFTDARGMTWQRDLSGELSRV
jgi:hypothetical protein